MEVDSHPAWKTTFEEANKAVYLNGDAVQVESPSKEIPSPPCPRPWHLEASIFAVATYCV